MREELLKVNSPEGTDRLNLQPVYRFIKVAPTTRVRFADGKVIPMNRRERRAMEKETHIKLVRGLNAIKR